MKTIALVIGCAIISFASVPAKANVTIDSTSTIPIFVGSFSPGDYLLRASGTISLAGPLGSGFDVNANGAPQPGFTADPAYAVFLPNGYDRDPTNNQLGIAGAGFNLGSLVGTFAPDGSSGYFLIGTSSTRALNGNLYALVNDTFAANNAGSFSLSVAAVPEPATWAMMLLGFGAAGFLLRRKRVSTPLVKAA